MSVSVEAKVWSGDSAQKIASEPGGRIRISGVSDGHTPDPRINLYFDGIDVNVDLDQGMTPHETFRAISAAMPRGYRAELVLGPAHPHAEVHFEVRREG